MSKSKHNQKEKQDASIVLYGAVIAAVLVAAVAMMVWNSNFFQRRATAVTVNGTEYSATDVSYYYANTRQYYNYMSMMGMGSYDSSLPAEAQMYNETTTWHDYFCQEAVNALRQDAAIYDKAMEAGHILSKAGQANVNSTLASLESSRLSSGYSSRNAYVKAVYGSIMTYDDVVDCVTRAAIASDFSTAQRESYEYTQEELNGYYAENKDALDTYSITQFLFPVADPTIAEDGSKVEMTEEEKTAALETAKQETKTRAEKLLAKLNASTDLQALMDEFADDLGTSFLSKNILGSSLDSTYAAWCKDPQRKINDATVMEYSDSYYCVVRFEGRFQDTTPSVNVRHALIEAGSEPTEEQYAQAQAKAEELLAQWKADGATEDAFALLAEEHSADTGSAVNGGLLNVTAYSGFGQSFTDWAMNEGHNSGDTGLVKNDFSSTKGYHIMYYVGEDVPYWTQAAQSALSNQDVAEWEKELLDAYTAETGDGMKYVG